PYTMVMSQRFPNSLPPGTKLLWYEIRTVLGHGGFGITYLAHDTNLDQAVALKEYLPSIFATRNASLDIIPISGNHQTDFDWGRQRFIEEGRVLARFDHPAIVRVYSVFEARGTAYLVMRYEVGETLEVTLKRDKRLSEGKLRAILEDVMPGLERLHAAGFIHRDIKPGNLYLRRDGHALLIDFGAARQALNSQTQTVTSLVSPGYAPFEQYRSDGAAQGPWTDIYALGATAYRVITGRAPPPAVDRSHHILDGDGDLLPALVAANITDYSWGLLAAIDRALAFRAADRPQTLTAWREMLWSVEPDTAPPPAFSTPRALYDGSVTNDAATTIPITGSADDASAATDLDVPTITEPITARSRSALPTAPRAWRTLGLVAAAIAVVVALSIVGLREYSSITVDAGALRNPANPPDIAVFSVTPPGVREPAQETPTVNPIPGLLAAADADFAALRLTTPVGNNAFEMYREVLRLDPPNQAAQQGLDRIVGRYVELAASASNRRDFAGSREYLDIAGRIRPDDQRLPEARRILAGDEAAASTARAATARPRSALGEAYNHLIVRPTRWGAAKVRRAWRSVRN
ncbi:MAG: serine/threonine protein kinase, partial [Gammaproteobacteria bacterium]